MSTNPIHPYEPDYGVTPGEILAEILAATGMSQGELAVRSGLSARTISLIGGGKAPVTPETALLLERVLEVEAEVWNNLESHHRLFLARRQGNGSSPGRT